jgi:hypothetical protein
MINNYSKYIKTKEVIRTEIMLKNNGNPYYVNSAIYNVQNDHDHFPYSKYFKSHPKKPFAIIDDRIAGWSPSNTYESNIKPDEIKKPNLCFQSPCSIVYPCYQQTNDYISTNRGCEGETDYI